MTLVEKITEVLKEHDKHRPFTAEGIKITGESDIDIVEQTADINLPAWDSADYYANFIGTDVKEWCKALDLDYNVIRAEMSPFDEYVTDYDIKEYILKEYEKEVLDVIADVIEDQTADYISSAESLLEVYEEWQREIRRGNE